MQFFFFGNISRFRQFKELGHYHYFKSPWPELPCTVGANPSCTLPMLGQRASRCSYYSAFACESQSSWSWILKCRTNSNLFITAAFSRSNLFISNSALEHSSETYNKGHQLSHLIHTSTLLNRKKYYYPLSMSDETGSERHTARHHHLNPWTLRRDTCNYRNWTEKEVGSWVCWESLSF